MYPDYFVLGAIFEFYLSNNIVALNKSGYVHACEWPKWEYSSNILEWYVEELV